jgi:serine/threonine protein phosphatase PrpC
VPIRLRAGAVSDTGAHRAINQDAAFAAPWGAAVADGVGGGPAGDLASAAFVHRLAAGRLDAIDAEHLAVSVRAANWDLRAHVARDPSLHGMATTFTGIFVSLSGSLLLAHTGDSRAYLLRDGQLVQQTRDDSYVQALVDRGMMTAEDAASHPRRNLITASLSGAERGAATVVEYTALPGDRWMLCSDGLTDYVPISDVAELLRKHSDPETAAAASVALALEAGTRDNVTVVVSDIVGDDEVDAAPHARFYGAAAARFTEGLESA